jgi:hypothetical protein
LAGGLALALPSSACTTCSKARGDAFSSFHPEEKLEAPGRKPRRALRYQPARGQDVVYQLSATRKGGPDAPRARMRLRVALGFGSSPPARSFRLRLLNVLRLEPIPDRAQPQVGPTHVLLGGTLGPRGALARLEDSADVPTPVNLALVAPLLLPAYPQAAVGPEASWRVARRFGWRRDQAADTMLQRTGYHSRTDLLLHRHYRYEKRRRAGELDQTVLSASFHGRLRNRTRTLGHRLGTQGRIRGTLKATVDRATGMPESVSVSLQGRYTLQRDGLKSKARETITLSLVRER